MKNNKTYWKTIWTFIFDEETREPLWIVDDLVINPNNLSIEALIVKNSFFKSPKILRTEFLNNLLWKDIFINIKKIENIEKTENIKNILLKKVWIIWNKVINESWDYIWHVKDLIFNWETFQWITLVVQKSFLWIFFYWKEFLIWNKSIIKIEKDWILIKDVNLVKDMA